MTTAAASTTRQLQELEEKFDPEMRFRPLGPPATHGGGRAADRAVAASTTTPPASACCGDHAPRRAPGLRARADLPRLRRTARRCSRSAAAHRLARARRRAAGRLAAGRRGGRRRCSTSRRSSTTWRSASATRCTLDVVMGIDPDRRAARGHAPQHGLAAAADRHRASWSTRWPGRSFPGLLKHAGASWSQLVNHQYLTSQGIYGVAVGVVATYVFHFVLFGVLATRIGLGQLFLDIASTRRRALRRRAGQGERVRLGDVRHAVGLVGGQRGDGRLADHPRDDPRRLQARVRRRGRGRRRPPAGRSRRRCWARRRS